MPTGTSINWSAVACRGAAPVLEVTLSGSGRKAGAGKAASAARSDKTTPSLCKAAMLQRWHALRAAAAGKHGGSDARHVNVIDGAAAENLSYHAAKVAAGDGHYVRFWASLRQEPSLFALWVPKPQRLEMFTS